MVVPLPDHTEEFFRSILYVCVGGGDNSTLVKPTVLVSTNGIKYNIGFLYSIVVDGYFHLEIRYKDSISIFYYS